MRKLSNIYNRYGIRATFNAEIMQQLTFRDFQSQHPGNKVIVETYAHDLRKMNHNIPRFMRTYVSSDACIDLNLNGMKFFRADARRLFDEMFGLAATGKTIYPRSVYSNK